MLKYRKDLLILQRFFICDITINISGKERKSPLTVLKKYWDILTPEQTLFNCNSRINICLIFPDIMLTI